MHSHEMVAAGAKYCAPTMWLWAEEVDGQSISRRSIPGTKFLPEMVTNVVPP